MSDSLSTLLRTLTDKDGLTRKRARDELVELGTPATLGLMELLKDKRTHVRWEAAKALSEIGDPRSAPALVTALEDNDPGIRWMGAEGLVKIEMAALPPLFEALVEHGGSIRLREGADHVLKVLAKNEKLPPSAEPSCKPCTA
ncbi:MAG: HEAT repeat domain-containing protein, partial [Anaerolineales bacterium]|nr:HEAT repeat domain-containing protein [Anaerolineales bacterium]